MNMENKSSWFFFGQFIMNGEEFFQRITKLERVMFKQRLPIELRWQMLFLVYVTATISGHMAKAEVDTILKHF